MGKEDFHIKFFSSYDISLLPFKVDSIGNNITKIASYFFIFLLSNFFSLPFFWHFKKLPIYKNAYNITINSTLVIDRREIIAFFKIIGFFLSFILFYQIYQKHSFFINSYSLLNILFYSFILSFTTYISIIIVISIVLTLGDLILFVTFKTYEDFKSKWQINKSIISYIIIIILKILFLITLGLLIFILINPSLINISTSSISSISLYLSDNLIKNFLNYISTSSISSISLYLSDNLIKNFLNYISTSSISSISLYLSDNLIKNFLNYSQVHPYKYLVLGMIIRNIIYFFLIPLYLIYFFSLLWDIFSEKLITSFINIKMLSIEPDKKSKFFFSEGFFELPRGKNLLEKRLENLLTSYSNLKNNTIPLFILLETDLPIFIKNGYKKIQNQLAQFILRFTSGMYLNEVSKTKVYAIIFIQLFSFLSLIFFLFSYYYWLIKSNSFFLKLSLSASMQNLPFFLLPFQIPLVNFSAFFLSFRFELLISGVITIFIWTLSYLRALYNILPSKSRIIEGLKSLYINVHDSTGFSTADGKLYMYIFPFSYSTFLPAQFLKIPSLPVSCCYNHLTLVLICRKVENIINIIFKKGSTETFENVLKAIEAILEDLFSMTNDIKRRMVFEILAGVILISVLTSFFYIFTHLLAMVK